MLARLEAFLPAMKQANEDLENRIRRDGQQSVDIENVGDEQEERSEGDGDEQHHQPEERTVSTDAWASVFRASVETFATFARRVRDFPVRGQFVPRVIRTTLAFGVRISW